MSDQTQTSEGATGVLTDTSPPELPPPLAAWVKPSPAAGRRALVVAVPAGIAIDLALRAPGVGVAAAALPIVLAALLLFVGAVPSVAGRLALMPVPLLAPWLALRANPTTQTLDALACVGCLALAVSFGTPGGLVPAAGAGRAGRVVDAAAGLIEGPRFALQGLRESASAPARSTIRAIGRGIALAVPVAIVVGGLLADADRSFAALFGAEGAWTGFGHLALVALGGVAFLGLVRTGVAQRRGTPWPHPVVGQVEASIVLGALVLLFALFALTRLLQLAKPSLLLDDADFANEARAGFFQLVAVVVITVLVLALVRATVAAIGRVILGCALTAVSLTLVIVAVAIHRLLRYRDEFGLTQLRLGTTWVSAWLGFVIVVIGASFVVRAAARWLPAVVLGSGLALLLAWNVGNPDATIARTNMTRGGEHQRFDPDFLGGMSPDAIPTIVAELDRLAADERHQVLVRLCLVNDDVASSGTGWNLARQRAADALRDVCR